MIDPEQEIGQTFQSRRPMLNRIHLWLRPSSQAKKGDILTIELFTSPESNQPLLVREVPIVSIGNKMPFTLDFPAQKTEAGQTYYLHLRVNHSEVNIFGRNIDQYPLGQIYINRQPAAADIAFRLGYAYGFSAALSDLVAVGRSFPNLFLMCLVIWLPGRLLLRLTHVDRKFEWGERIALSIGLSLALIPVVMTWTTELGLHWNNVGVKASIVICFLAFIWSCRRDFFHVDSRRLLQSTKKHLPLLIIFVISYFIRLVMVRDLSAPAWVDSVHHALITRLILDQGGFPTTYTPFLNMQTASYHAGYHSTLASVIWLTGSELSQAMLDFGQLLNACCIFAVYLLSKSLTHNTTAATVAAWFSGIFSPMPAYYTSWGRYTQLSGLLILPVCFALVSLITKHQLAAKPTLTLRQGRPNSLSTVILSAIACGGLFLTHYRVLAFFCGLVFAFFCVDLITHLRRKVFFGWMQQKGSYLLLILLCSIIFTYPWWPEAISSLFIPSIAWENSSQPFDGFSWSFLHSAFGIYIYALAFLGMVWAVIQRQSFPWVILAWVGICFGLANLGVWQLPGAGWVNNTSVAISLFMPLSILGGYGVGWAINGWKRIIPSKWLPASQVGLVICALALSFFASRSLVSIINPSTILFRNSDRIAIQWISTHLPPHERVLINPFSWGYGLYAGGDGGYWISPLALRPTLPSPVLAGLEGDSQAESQWIQKVIQNADAPEALHALLIQKDIHFIYLGSKGGVLSPTILSRHPLFSTIFSFDNTWVFELR